MWSCCFVWLGFVWWLGGLGLGLGGLVFGACLFYFGLGLFGGWGILFWGATFAGCIFVLWFVELLYTGCIGVEYVLWSGFYLGWCC